MPSQLGKTVEKKYCTKHSARQASEANLPKGVTAIEVDYDDPASLAKALKGCTLSSPSSRFSTYKNSRRLKSS